MAALDGHRRLWRAQVLPLSLPQHEHTQPPPAPARERARVHGVRDRRLVLHDQATYPEPLLHLLQYHAIGRCREHLLQQTALRLGQELPRRQGSLRAVVTGVLTAFGLQTHTAGAPAGEEVPRAKDGRPPPVGIPPLAGYGYPMASGRGANSLQGGATAQPSALNAIASKIATARSSRSGRSAAGAADAARVRASAAEAFAFTSTCAAAERDEPPAPTGAADAAGGGADDEPVGVSRLLGVSEHSSRPRPAVWHAAGGGEAPDDDATFGAAALALGAHAMRPATSVEDEVDSLRARMPDRSTESLREMVRRRNY